MRRQKWGWWQHVSAVIIFFPAMAAWLNTLYWNKSEAGRSHFLFGLRFSKKFVLISAVGFGFLAVKKPY
jgi:hypothetical protein